MAAIAHPLGPPEPPPRCRLVIDGGRSALARRRAVTYRRRRLAVLALLVLVAGGGVTGVRVVAGGADRAPDGADNELEFTEAMAAQGSTETSATHVVQPGDTLWSVAVDLADGRDIRVVAHRLAEVNGTQLQIGQLVRIPADLLD